MTTKLATLCVFFFFFFFLFTCTHLECSVLILQFVLDSLIYHVHFFQLFLKEFGESIYYAQSNTSSMFVWSKKCYFEHETLPYNFVHLTNLAQEWSESGESLLWVCLMFGRKIESDSWTFEPICSNNIVSHYYESCPSNPNPNHNRHRVSIVVLPISTKVLIHLKMPKKSNQGARSIQTKALTWFRFWPSTS